MTGRIYSMNMNAVSVSAAITLLQLKAGSTVTCQIMRAWCSQSGSTTSTQQRIQINRKSAAATVTTFTPLLFGPTDAAAASVGGTTSTGTNASGEGTDTDVLVADAFNILTGWLWVPTPEERIVVGPGGFLGLKFPAAPGSALTIEAGFIFQEIG